MAFDRKKYEYIKEHILDVEGEWAESTDGSDYRCTMRGISIALYRQYFGTNKNCDDLKVITEDDWDTIFRGEFYDRIQADKIKNWSLAKLCVDICFHSGRVVAIKKIQKCLGTTPDGIVGPKTLAALNQPNSKVIFERIWNMRKGWFNRIVYNNPKKMKYLNGWMNRLNKIKYED